MAGRRRGSTAPADCRQRWVAAGPCGTRREAQRAPVLARRPNTPRHDSRVIGAQPGEPAASLVPQSHAWPPDRRDPTLDGRCRAGMQRVLVRAPAGNRRMSLRGTLAYCSRSIRAAWKISLRQADWRRRHGRGVPSGRSGARPARRDQNASAGVPRVRGPPSPRSQGDGGGVPSESRTDLRSRDVAWDADARVRVPSAVERWRTAFASAGCQARRRSSWES